MPTCLLVRHGRTTANAGGTLAGWTPGVDLDEAGVAQVRALASRLDGVPVVRIVSSPLLRCRRTAAELAAALPAVDPVEDERLAECRYGSWTGRALKDLAREPLWRVVQEQPSAARFPDGADYPGESIAAMASRAVAAIRDADEAVAREHGERACWMAVSHGDVIKAVLADAAGSHLDQFQRIVVDPASLSVVRYTPRRPFVLRINDSSAALVSALVPPAEPAEAAVGGGAGGGAPDEGDAAGDGDHHGAG